MAPRAPRRTFSAGLGRGALPSFLCSLAALYLPFAQAAALESGNPADGSAPSLSVERAVSLSLQRNQSVLIANEDGERARAVVKEAYASVLPTIGMQASYQRNFTKPAFFLPEDLVEEGQSSKVEIGSDYQTAGQIRVDQVLYGFGRLGNALAAAKILKQIASLGVENARSNLVFAVKQAYYRVLLADRVASIQSRSLKQAELHLSEVQNKFSQGTVSRFDLLRARVEAKNREPAVISAQNDLSLAVQDLKRIVGIDDAPDPVLTDSLFYVPEDLDEDSAVAEALSRRSDILSLRLNVEQSHRRLSIEKAGRLPTLGFFGQVLLQGEANDDPFDPFDSRHRAVSTSAGIALTVPIFDGFRTKARIQRARADLRKAEYELSLAREAVGLEARKAVKDLRSLRRGYEAQGATVALAEETYHIAETRFKNGISTQLELADAATALELARVNFATTLYEYDVALAHLERVLGREASSVKGALDAQP